MTRPTQRSIFLALILGLFILRLTGDNGHAQSKTVEAPAFTLEFLDGDALQNSELKGKLQVLKFVATY